MNFIKGEYIVVAGLVILGVTSLCLLPEGGKDVVLTVVSGLVGYLSKDLKETVSK